MIIVAGPTASGKSAFALALAQKLGGTVINADAMQCYRELRVITARPSPADEALAPHRLYGVRPAAAPANAAWWRAAALAEMADCALPILCGGTGMYLSALINGIAEIPDPGAAARAEARALLAALGAPALHARLDAATAAKTDPHNGQRVARAYEVYLGTGRGLADWQAATKAPLRGWDVRMALLEPPRDTLALGLPADLPILRAHGVPELARHLRGELSLEDAAAQAVLATSQYTKRQTTWFRHQKLTGDSAMQIIQTRISGFTQYLERYTAEFVNFIKARG
jgi:tRNA dimethylallyltransferase